MQYILLLLGALCAVALAGAPTIDQNLSTFPQNGGTFTFTGSGFVRENPGDQFVFVLRRAGTATPTSWGSNYVGSGYEARRGVGATNPASDAVTDTPARIWRGCMPGTIVVNPAGTVATCTMEYIPDAVLEQAGAGTTTIEVDVCNDNGCASLSDTSIGVTVAVIENVNEQIFPSTNVIPRAFYGITVVGVGFPAAGSYSSNTITSAGLVITTQDATLSINLLAASVDNSLGRYAEPNQFLTTAPQVDTDRNLLDVTTPENLRFLGAGASADGCECYVDRNRIDCGFCNFFDLFGSTPADSTPNSAVTADIRFQSSLEGVTAVDEIGPTQIAIVSSAVRSNGDVTVDSVTLPSGVTSNGIWNQEELVLTGSGFATFPALHSNVIVWHTTPPTPPATLPAFKCIPTSVNAAGTRLTCRLANMLPTPTVTTSFDVRVVVVSGEVYSFSVDPTSSTFTSTVVGSFDGSTAAELAVAVDPRSAPLQQDARFLTLTSGRGLFPSPFLGTLDVGDPPTGSAPFEGEVPFSGTGAARLPAIVDVSVTLQGLESGDTVCRARYPENDVLTDDGTVTGAPSCQIVSASPSEIRLRIPPITQPIGTSVLVNEIAMAVADASTAPDALNAPNIRFYDGSTPTVVGVVAPGAGVGGDPHFFGFLGEKYEFAGVAGETYNLLTDNDVQLNAMIGKWHFTHGEETIIKSLALKTRSHRILMDAGGNHLGTSGFSILLDGEPLAPNATEATSLGHDGHVRWNPLSRNDDNHLPLWERHNGIAIVEIVLEDYRLEILAVEEGRDENGVWRKQPSRFLDFMCQMYDPSRQPHGLFGQSAHLPPGKRSVENWSIQGTDEDYKVSDVFGDDFTFNKYRTE